MNTKIHFGVPLAKNQICGKIQPGNESLLLSALSFFGGSSNGRTVDSGSIEQFQRSITQLDERKLEKFKSDNRGHFCFNTKKALLLVSGGSGSLKKPPVIRRPGILPGRLCFSKEGTMVETDLPIYIPLDEAASRYNIPLETLRRAVENHLVQAVTHHGNLSMVEVAETDIIAMVPKTAKILPTFIASNTATQRYNIPNEILEQAIQNDTIRAVLIEGELAVAEEDVTALAKQLEKQAIKTLPAFITLDEAAKQYDVPLDVLIEAINKDAIKAIRVENVIKVAENDVKVLSVQILKQQENDELISISEAARRLGLPSGTVSQWQEYGWLPILGTGIRRAKLISWYQAQTLARLHQERSRRGSRLIPKGQELSVFLSP